MYNGTFCRGVVYDSDPMRNVRVGTVLGCAYSEHFFLRMDGLDVTIFFNRRL